MERNVWLEMGRKLRTDGGFIKSRCGLKKVYGLNDWLSRLVVVRVRRLEEPVHLIPIPLSPFLIPAATGQNQRVGFPAVFLARNRGIGLCIGLGQPNGRDIGFLDFAELILVEPAAPMVAGELN